MANHDHVFISSFGHYSGVKADIAELPEMQDSLQDFYREGLKYYRRTELGPTEMITDTIDQSLEKSRVPPQDIDAVILVTTSFYLLRHPSYGDFSWISICRNLQRAGLTNAHPIGSFMFSCGGLHLALKTARAFIHSGQYANILIVLFDINEPGVTRLLMNSFCLSDVAASVLVSREAASDHDTYEVLSNEVHADTALAITDSEPRVAMKNFVLFTRRFLSRFPSNLPYEHVLMNNGRTDVRKLLHAQLGNQGTLYDGDVSEFSHMWSSDNVVALERMTRQNHIQRGETALLFANGPHAVGATVVQRI